MLIYVDDIIVVSSSESNTNALLQLLRDDFAIKDLGILHYVLGVEVIFSEEGNVLYQKKYIGELLQKTNMVQCKPVATPMSTSEKLSKESGKPLSPEQATNYRSIVGALQYLNLTKLDISYAVNKIC